MMPTENDLLNSDELLVNAINELLQNSHVIKSKIYVSSYHCDITLEGTVETEEEKDAVTSMVNLVQGVGIIHNNIVVTGRMN